MAYDSAQTGFMYTDLNSSEIRYKKLCIFLTGGAYPTHLVCLRHCRKTVVNILKKTKLESKLSPAGVAKGPKAIFFCTFCV